MPDFAKQRKRMVEVHLSQRGIRDPHVLAAMRKVPRERFVQEGLEEFAYEDAALPIEHEQTISQPYIVAAMIEAAEVQPGDHVLEVGAGSGMQCRTLPANSGRSNRSGCA
jgi:protein-L-isoaspartate(D-aspartate) O-methyltransferase